MRPAIRIFASLLLIAVVCGPVTAWAADKFKPFKLKTTDGVAKTLEDYSGKATLVSFFFPTCVFCNTEFPAVQHMYDEYKDKGLSVVWINMVPDENKLIADWQEKHQYTIPVLIGASQAALQRDYKIKMTPTHYLLDAKGNVLYHQSGYKAGDEKSLEDKILEALKTVQ